MASTTPGPLAALRAAGLAGSRPAALLLDFDGVIVDSIAIKVDAYAQVYEGESAESLAAIREHQRTHGGVTRRIKFRHFERDVFGRSVTDERIEALSAAFTRIVHEAVVACPLIPGALDLLERAHGHARLHVVSGTPQEELDDIVARRGLARYFASVHGAPANKPDTFAALLAASGLDAARMLAVGDALTEYEAARDLGIPFLGVATPGEPDVFPAGVPVVATLDGVGAALGFAGGERRP